MSGLCFLKQLAYMYGDKNYHCESGTQRRGKPLKKHWISAYEQPTCPIRECVSAV